MTSSQIPDRMKWWAEVRFGMFIHWGLYAIPARGEWVMYCERIPKREYARLADEFDPKKYDANEWVAQAQDAGMRYMVLTTRHHDGFSLFDSQVSDFTSVKTNAARDLVGEYVDACRGAGMRIGFYYSLLDWRWPAYWDGPKKDPEGWNDVREYVHSQVRELMTNYGKIDILWYDGSWPHSAEDWEAQKLNKMVRSVQPEIIINNRSGMPEDLETPEQHIRGHERPWETCMTMDDLWWGYHPGDANLKSSMQLVRTLAKCVEGNGNFLLNVGPKADGTIPEAQSQRLSEIGKWMRANSDSIYGAGPSLFRQPHLGHVTAKANKVYLHVTCWPGPELVAVGIGNKVNKAWMLATGKELPFDQKDDRLFVHGLPETSPDPIDTVIALEIEGEPKTAEASFWK